MSEQFAKFERTWIDGLNRGDVSVADGVFAPDCVIHMNGGPVPNLSLSGFKQMVGGLLAAFPEIRLTIEDQVITADKVATRWTAEGTHTGPLGEIKPTGRRIRIGGLIIDHVSGDRVVERWELWDQAGMLQQLGLLG
jgi:predicted ester cyclase